MTRHVFSRRGFGAALAATLTAAAPLRAAEVVFGGSASRLGPPADNQDYAPPATIAAIYDLYRRMTAPVRVDGHGPYPFVVDTGANQSVIALELARSLALPLGEAAEVNGVAGARSTAATHARLAVGSRLRGDSPLMVFPRADIGGDGLLGLDDLDGQAVTLDFRGRTLRLEPGARLRSDPDAVVMRARRRSGLLTLIDADLDGMAVTAFLDSGAQNTVGNLALRSRVADRRLNVPWLSAPILSATGQTIQAEIATLPRLRVGGLSVASWPIAFADLYTFRLWGLTDRPAILLGVDLLSRFEYVCLDFARDEVRFRLPQIA